VIGCEDRLGHSVMRDVKVCPSSGSIGTCSSSIKHRVCLSVYLCVSLDAVRCRLFGLINVLVSLWSLSHARTTPALTKATILPKLLTSAHQTGYVLLNCVYWMDCSLTTWCWLQQWDQFGFSQHNLRHLLVKVNLESSTHVASRLTIRQCKSTRPLFWFTSIQYVNTRKRFLVVKTLCKFI